MRERWTLAGLAAVAACLIAVGGAGATTASTAMTFGFTEDASKYATDGGASIYAKTKALGMNQNAFVVYWNPSAPTTIQEKAFLDRSVPVAIANGITLTFRVYPGTGDDPATAAFEGGPLPQAFATDTDARVAAFANYLKLLVQTYPQVKRFVVLNEPNEPFFLAPQFSGGQNVSAGVALKALAAGYDALKSVGSGIQVIGLGISNDGNDNTSTSPVKFLKALGDAYKASGRTKPIMDDLGFHLHARNSAAFNETTSYPWPNIGPADLDRLKQAFWDAFNSTGQPTYQEGAARTFGPAQFDSVATWIAELAKQVQIAPANAGAYTGSENVPVTTEAEQATAYAALVKLFACDPTVEALLFFLLIDQKDLARFQSGFQRADLTDRPATSTVPPAIAMAPSCAPQKSWTHATQVIGAEASDLPEGQASAQQTNFNFPVAAGEDAMVTAGMFPIPNAAATLNPSDVSAALMGVNARRSGSVAIAPVRTDKKLVRAKPLSNKMVLKGELDPGFYRVGVLFQAAMNAKRTSVFVGPVLQIGGGGGSSPADPPPGFTERQYLQTLQSNVDILNPLVMSTQMARRNALNLATLFALLSHQPAFQNLFVNGGSAGLFFTRLGSLSMSFKKSLAKFQAALKASKMNAFRLPQALAPLEAFAPEQLPSTGFKQVPTARAPSAPPVKAGQSVSVKAASAATALNNALSKAVGYLTAYSQAVERAYLAFKAKDGKYARIQSRAAAKFATSAANELDKLPKLAADLGKAVSTQVSKSELAKLQTQFKTAGFTSELSGLLKKLGLKQSEIGALQKQVAGAALPSSFPLVLLDSRTLGAMRALANNLRSYAKALSKV